MTEGRTESDAWRAELADLLRDHGPALTAAGYPGAEVIEPSIRTISAFGNPKCRKLGKKKAWAIERYTHESPGSGAFMGVDGTRYKLARESWASSMKTDYLTQATWSVTALSDLEDEDDFGRKAAVFVRRLLTRISPGLAIPTKTVLFGVPFQVTFRPSVGTRQPAGELLMVDVRAAQPGFLGGRVVIPVPSDLNPRKAGPTLDAALGSVTANQAREREEELLCDDPSSGAIPPKPGPPGSRPESGRQQQIRYSFMSWLRLVTTTGWEEFDAHPSMFLWPQPPWADGGPVRQEEVASLTGDLVRSGLAEWVDSYSGRYPPWHLILTDSGLQEARELHGAYASPERTRLLLASLLNWTGRRAKEPHTVDLPLFLSSPDSEVAGMTASVLEVYRATRWLVNRGYLTQSHNCIPTTDNCLLTSGRRPFPNPLLSLDSAIPLVKVGVTRDGLMCVDEYQGDAMAMREAQRRGDDRRTFSFGSTGNVAIDSSGFSQSAGDVMQQPGTIDLAELLRFAQAVAQVLPVLVLEPEAQRAAEMTVSQILAAADSNEPDHPKLAALGRSLRAIIEGTATNVMTSVLLGIWKG